jgi:hypothetical protein
MKTKLLFCLLALSLVCPASTFAYEDKSMEVVADVVAVRPGCFVATMVGSVLFVLALPFAATSKSVKKTAHVLVVTPAHATFNRPIGDFESLDNRLKH